MNLIGHFFPLGKNISSILRHVQELADFDILTDLQDHFISIHWFLNDQDDDGSEIELSKIGTFFATGIQNDLAAVDMLVDLKIILTDPILILFHSSKIKNTTENIALCIRNAQLSNS